MKVHQVKEFNSFSKQVTEDTIKKFPYLIIDEPFTRKLLTIFQDNLRNEIIRLSHKPPNKVRAFLLKDDPMKYHISLKCATTGKQSFHYHSILLELIPK